MIGVSEITILKEGDITITNLRAIIGTKTYPMSNIASVSMRVNEPKLFLPIFFLTLAGVCSVLVAIADMKEYSRYLTRGLYLIIAGILFFVISKATKYSVRIKISSGELNIFEAYDRNYVERIVEAMNEAIVLRG